MSYLFMDSFIVWRCQAFCLCTECLPNSMVAAKWFHLSSKLKKKSIHFYFTSLSICSSSFTVYIKRVSVIPLHLNVFTSLLFITKHLLCITKYLRFPFTSQSDYIFPHQHFPILQYLHFIYSEFVPDSVVKKNIFNA